jgi:hypothetical protein
MEEKPISIKYGCFVSIINQLLPEDFACDGGSVFIACLAIHLVTNFLVSGRGTDKRYTIGVIDCLDIDVIVASIY